MLQVMRRRSCKSGNSLLDFPKKRGRRQLRTSKELSRNGERGSINCLETKSPLSSLVTFLQPKRTKGRWRNQSEPAKPKQRADLMEPLYLAIALRMERSRRISRDPKRRADSSPDGGGKLCTSVRGEDSLNTNSWDPGRQKGADTGLS